MIKALLKTDEGKKNLALLGLTHNNLERLKNGMPIKFNLQELGLEPCDVFLFAGEDELKIRQALELKFGQPQKINDHSQIQWIIPHGDKCIGHPKVVDGVLSCEKDGCDYVGAQKAEAAKPTGLMDDFLG